MAIDLVAEIVPGKSAAGFSLGMLRVDFEVEIADAVVGRWTDASLQIQEAVQRAAGWLYVSGQQMGMSGSDFWGAYYFGRGAVKLEFNQFGELVLIEVAEGYGGRLSVGIGVGDYLDKWSGVFGIEYDDVEDLYIPAIGSGLAGVMFRVDPAVPMMGFEQRIVGMILTSLG